MDAQTLSDVMGGALSLPRYAELLPAYEEACRGAAINNLERAAQWAAQLGHESVGLSALEEYASGAAYEGRADLGNTVPGDGVRYKGRGAIMITGRANYRNLSAWAFQKGYVPTRTYFEDNPVALQSNEHAFVGAVWYWTVARPGINAAADQGYTLDVTRMINGGTNGIDDRRVRYNRAKAMGDRILPGQGGPAVQAVEKVLEYPRDWVAQEYFWDCGPASAQSVILAKTGNLIDEDTLIREIGTTVNGTDWVGQIAPVLNRRIGGGFKVADMPARPSPDDMNTLWDRLGAAVDNGYGIVANIVSPPSNRPVGVRGSVSPNYGTGTIWHYVALGGRARDADGSRSVWVIDSGFPPITGYWCSLENVAWLIAEKGYVYPADVKASQLQGGLTVSEADRIIAFMKGYMGPGLSDIKDCRQQITGGRDSIPGDPVASYPGWPALGQNAEGNNLTLVDAVAAIRRDNAEIMKRLDRLEGK